MAHDRRGAGPGIAARFPDPAVQGYLYGERSAAEVKEGHDMHHDTCFARNNVDIIDPYGFSMRHAEDFARLARQYQSEVRVSHEGKHFDGKSILDLMTMAAECGSRLELEALGPDAAAAVDALADLVRSYPVAVGEGLAWA